MMTDAEKWEKIRQEEIRESVIKLRKTVLSVWVLDKTKDEYVEVFKKDGR